ncbi:hypothetical protein BA062_29295 [Prauserella flavalba]|uniref:Uncharacterized protein n=1 Tax=Prauserella flavalba TaxID=1477506 RepID=A0A318LGZ4_9PSEU|nr:hypothetical protein BA062_29295 [Prauserella flavalba]
MVTTVATAAVPVPPAVVAGEQLVDRGQQVVVAARAGLQDRQPRRRVRDPDVQEAVARVGIGEKSFRFLGQVLYHGVSAGTQLDLGGVHSTTVSLTIVHTVCETVVIATLLT